MPTIMEVALSCRWNNQITDNVFNFLWDGVGDSPGNLSVALMGQLGWSNWDVGEDSYPDGSFAQAFKQLVSVGLLFDIVTVRDVYSTTDFYEWTFPIPGNASQGSQSSGKASPTLAFGFKSSKTRTDIKRGAKRFPGVVLGQLSDGGTFTAPTLTYMAGLATAMSNVLTAPGSTNFLPAICKKDRVPVMSGGEPTGTFKYVYFTDSTEQVANTAAPVVWDLVTTQRTQTSRQFNRGR